MGRLIYLRLNSGSLIIGEGKARRRVCCCPPGTSDNIVVLPGKTIFVEYKGEKGKQTREQKTFEKMVSEQGHQYWLVYDFDAFKDAIEEVLR
ncbi:MAG: VRR-NUC domain-containing protein [Dehalococcoidia bacterium]|nr:VRR-NUC domain-containing protein [Dehalococcoidia bacterium]